VTVTFDVDSSNLVAPVGIVLQLPAMMDTSLVLQLPSTEAGRPKLYENVLDLHATTPGAHIVATDRPDRVRLVAAPGDAPAIAWRLRATPRSYSSNDAHNHSDIGAEWAQIVGYDALVLPAIGSTAAVRAVLRFRGVPTGGAIATSFGTLARDSSIIARATLSELRHAVYVLAIAKNAVRVYSSAVSGGDLTVVIRGRHAIDDSSLDARVRRVMMEERRFWGGDVPEHYLVTIGVAPRGSLNGVRLVNAFVADIDSTRSMDERVSGLFAHELMHEWIGGQLAAAGNLPNGQFSWFTEGFDDFAAHGLMHTVGLLSDSAYAAVVNRDLSDHAFSSARDSSWDAVVRRFWSDDASYREAYVRGELIALTLDAELMRATHGKLGVDSVLHRMARDSPVRRAGLTTDTVVARFGEFLGAQSVRTMIERILDGGPVVLPDGALGSCMQSAIVQRASGPRTVSVQLWTPVIPCAK
jgi:predicted metalloprotease with PDZ domain